MKVLLTAFNGKLKSQVMDWPDNTGPTVRLSMDMDGKFFFDGDSKRSVAGASRPVVGVFESNGLFEFVSGIPGGGSAAVYHLVGVQ